MAKITHTQAQLTRKAARLQRMTDRYYGGKHIHGAERFLETEAGRVRVLCYGLENTRVLPLFVNIHGGGFVLGHPEMDDPYMPRVVEEVGVKIISVDYGLSPKFPFPAPLEQCYAVIKYAQEHADEFGIDPTRIAVGSHSRKPREKGRRVLNFAGFCAKFSAVFAALFAAKISSWRQFHGVGVPFER